MDTMLETGARPAPLLARVTPPSERLPPLRFLRTLARNPLETWPAALYQEPFLETGMMGRRALLLVEPDLIQQVLVREADAFGRTPEMIRALGPSLGMGLLTADGSHWRWQRRVASPAFRHDRLESFVPAMSVAAGETAARWSSLPAGTVLDVGHEMMRTTFDIIIATMFSGPQDLDTARFEEAISLSLDTTNWALLYATLGLPEWFPYPGMVKANRARRWMRESAARLVARRRSEHATGVERRGDLMDLLLEADDPEQAANRMTDRDVVDNLLTFIGAGHETTALALTWTFYALAAHPEATARALAEIETVVGAAPVAAAHLPHLNWTRQIVLEALRLYPSAPVIARRATRNLTVGTTALRPGDVVVIPIYALHRHERLWEDPQSFDPERFAPEAQAARHRYSFMPFGAGPRICIGMNFAINEAVAILATLLPRFRLEPVPGLAPKLTLKVTLRPEKPMLMTLAPRTGG